MRSSAGFSSYSPHRCHPDRSEIVSQRGTILRSGGTCFSRPRRVIVSVEESFVIRHFLSIVVLLAFSSLFAQNQSLPDPHQVPVMDGDAGPCSVAFTVTDPKGAPVYDARIKVHIEYGFAGVRRLDLEAATNVDGKTQFKGLPNKVKGKILYFRAAKGELSGSATYDPQQNCNGGNNAITLGQ